jgi:hypothetical protein
VTTVHAYQDADPLPPPPDKPCPVCGGERTAVKDSRVIDRLRFSHAPACRIGYAEDSTREADYRRATYWTYARWSTAAEVELLDSLNFRHDKTGARPVLAAFDGDGQLTNGADQPQLTLVSFASIGMRFRAFPNLIES